MAGNVRELENFAEKYATLQSLPDFEMSQLTPAPLLSELDRDLDTDDKSLDEIIAAKVNKIYRLENGNITKTAQRLAIDRNTVKRWLVKGEKGEKATQMGRH